MSDREVIVVRLGSGDEIVLCVNRVHIEGVIGGGRRLTITADVEYSEATGTHLAEKVESLTCPVAMNLHL